MIDARIARNLLSLMRPQIEQAEALLEGARELAAIANAAQQAPSTTPEQAVVAND